MLAIDLPVSVLTGLFLAEGGRRLLESDDRSKHRFVRTVVVVFSVFFITPVVFYFFMGWPAWEVNYLWKWQDNLRDTPIKAAIAFAVFFITVFPTYISFLIGKFFIRRKKAYVVRLGYVIMAILIGVIVLLTRERTFNIASTYEKYQAGETYSFFSTKNPPFFYGWLIINICFWASLLICYIWLRLKGRRYASQQASEQTAQPN